MTPAALIALAFLTTPAEAERPTAPVRRVYVIVEAGDRRSDLLRAEYERRTWPLAELRYEIDRNARVLWVDRTESRAAVTELPMIVVGQSLRPFPRNAFMASGEPIRALHGLVMEQAHSRSGDGYFEHYREWRDEVERRGQDVGDFYVPPHDLPEFEEFDE